MKSEAPAGARSVSTESAQWDLTNETWQTPMRVTVEEYRPDGKLAAREDRMGDGAAMRCVNSYNDAGLLLEAKTQLGDSVRTSLCLYDEQGRLIRQLSRDSDGSEFVGEERTYSDDGLETRVMYLPKVEGNTAVYCPVEGVDYSFCAPGAATMITTLDSHGRASEVILKDAEGAILRRVVLTHDESGRLVKDEVQLGGAPLVPDLPLFGPGAALFSSEYIYDELGRRVETVRRMLGLSEERETAVYDDHGNRTETTTVEQRRDGLNMNEGNIEYGEPKVERRQARMAYRYDARGNWVERVTSQRYGENPDFTPGSIERREIVYFI